MPLHMIKLCVGVDTVDDLRAWRRDHVAEGRPWIVHTKQSPKRAAEMTDGGSLYWVVKGVVLCRQAILNIETVGEGVARRCQVHLEPQIILTHALPRRPFQGWRYFEAKDAPPDLNADGGEAVPPELAAELRALGAW